MADLNPLTPDDLSDLKAKATVATPGEWRLGLLTTQEGEIAFVNAGQDCIARCDFGFSHLPAHANAKYIAAANPATLLRLIDMIEQRHGQIKKLRTALENLLNASERHIFSVECQSERAAAREVIAATEPSK